MVGDGTDLPEDLAKMLDEDKKEEETNDSFFHKLQNTDVDAKTKAQATVTVMKQATEKCALMWLLFIKNTLYLQNTQALKRGCIKRSVRWSSTCI